MYNQLNTMRLLHLDTATWRVFSQ